ncbi:penicillin-binding protein 2 [Oscillatoria amoena NRMC-F 0135]|nr:penicillin-binding protein 2 [Oscillatoria amoena NRMC-F 0135]
MIKWNAHTRALAVSVCGLTAFTILSARLVHLQAGKHEQYYEQAMNIHMRKIPIEAQRGNIYDIHGEILATSLPLKKITIDPIGLREAYELQIKRLRSRAAKDPSVRVPTEEELVTELAAGMAQILGAPKSEITEKLSRRTRYVEIARRVSPAVVEKIKELRPPQIYFDDDFLRSYPQDSLGSHVIGYVDHNQKKGLQGIEQRLHHVLNGQDGWRRIVRDSVGREIVPYRAQDVPPRNGYNVFLTLDSIVQHIVEDELDEAMAEFQPVAAMAIVTRPRTGEILAMSSRPTYNPNLPKTDLDAMRNRAVTDILEPGSTFKIVAVAAALNEGLATLETKYFCENGEFSYGGRILRDVHPYGTLTVQEGVQKSSNIMTAKIALELGDARMHEYVKRFGFGERTGVVLPAERAGIVNPLSRWSKISITRIPMGHEVATTPLQVLMAMNVIANGGMLMKPMLVSKVADSQGRVIEQNYPQSVRRVISPYAAEMMNEALRTVTERGGTAQRGAVEGFSVAGKTGTAQKIDPKTGTYYQGKRGKVVASFVGYLPAENPEFSIIVVLDEPQAKMTYGGQTAAPVFSRMAKRITQHMALRPAPNVNPSNMAAHQ